MSIDTRLEGDPDGIRGCAQWLKGTLACEVDQSVTELHKARTEAVTGWQGSAGPAFQARMDTGGRKADALRTDIETAANSLTTYADELDTAQQGMARARRIAQHAGLTVVDDRIEHPGPGPTLQALPADGPPTAAQVQAYEDSAAAARAHQARLDAYVLAAEEANRSRGIADAARAIGRNMWDDLRGKSLLQTADLVNSAVVGGLAAKHTSILRAQSLSLMDESKLAAERYLKAPGGSAEARAYNQQAYRKALEADEWARKADSAGRRIGSKIPIIGIGITAAGIGYDIHQGKPVGKAVISGVGGALAAAGTGALIGSAIPIPVVGTVAGAVVGLGVGLVASGALDWGYDQLPQGVKDSIEGGIKEAGSAVADAGDAIGDGAKKAWDAIF